MNKSTSFLLIFLLFFASCQKERGGRYCDLMKEGLVANNAGKVEKAINEAIARLEDEEHTADNLSRLATLLSSSCGITAEALCFSCNYSDPPQSEMQVTFQSGGTTRTKMIRITHAPSQRMIFRSMYD